MTKPYIELDPVGRAKSNHQEERAQKQQRANEQLSFGVFHRFVLFFLNVLISQELVLLLLLYE